MKKVVMAATAALIAVLFAHQADARGWSWFVTHIKAGDKCFGAHPTTYYGDGHRNADGSRFNPRGFSAASWDYPFGTILRVTNSQNGESVDVVVKDRGPARWIYNLGIHLDISTGAARAIHLGQNGRFESGYTCHTVVAMGNDSNGNPIFHRQARRHKRHSYMREADSASTNYMSRMGAGI